VRRVELISVLLCIAVLQAGCSVVRGRIGDASRITNNELAGATTDVAIITVLPDEYHAILRKLENVHHVVEPNGRVNLYVWATGEVRSPDRSETRSVVVAMAGEAGVVSGALATQATIDRWKPANVLLVGIAGGVHESVSLGDIVISSQIWGYEHGHLGTHYESGGGLFFQPDPMLEEAALRLGPDWRSRIAVTRPGPRGAPKVLAGKTASGDKVVENARSAYFAESLRIDGTVMAVEMEGTGAAAAVGQVHDKGETTGFLMIRGISDLIFSKNREEHSRLELGRNPQRGEWKSYASDVAASFAIGLVESYWKQ